MWRPWGVAGRALEPGSEGGETQRLMDQSVLKLKFLRARPPRAPTSTHVQSGKFCEKHQISLSPLPRLFNSNGRRSKEKIGEQFLVLSVKFLSRTTFISVTQSKFLGHHVLRPTASPPCSLCQINVSSPPVAPCAVGVVRP